MCFPILFTQIFWKHWCVSFSASAEHYASKGFSCLTTSFFDCAVHSVGMARSVFWFLYLCYIFVLCPQTAGAWWFLIIQCSVQRMWQGTVQSFYWKCFVLTDLNRPVFSGVVNSAVKGMGWKNEEKKETHSSRPAAKFFLSPNVRLCCDTVSSDYTSLIGKDFSEGISNMKYF